MSCYRATTRFFFVLCLLFLASPLRAQDVRFEQFSPQEEVHWKEVLKRDPGNAEAYYHLGRYYEFTKRIKEAAAYYRESTSRDAGSARSHFSLGKAYLELGRYDDGALALHRAVTLKPTFARAYHFLGLANINLGRYKEAADAFVKAYTYDPGWAETYYDNTTYGMHRELGESKEVMLRLIKDVYPINQHLARIMYNRWARTHGAINEFWEVVAGPDLPVDAGYHNAPIAGYHGPEEVGYQRAPEAGYQRRANQPIAPEDLAE